MENKTIASFLELIIGMFTKNKKPIMDKVTEIASSQVAKPVLQIQVKAGVNWADPKSKISKYFTVEEALMLRNWKRLANESDGLNDTVKKNLIEIFEVMDIIREYLNVPVYIKSAYRPSAYNVSIGGAAQSAHMASAEYAAVDFWCDVNGDGDKNGKDCDDIKAKLMPKLAEWGVRMEDNGAGATWVHIDKRPVPVGGNRFFKP